MRMRCKKIFLPALLCFLLISSACSEQNKDSFGNRSYEHINFTSSIEKEDCYLCGDRPDHEIGSYLGQDNVGLINVNTFDVLLVEINRYDRNGQLIEEATGTMQMGICAIDDTTVSIMTDVDRGYSHVSFQPSGNGIDADTISSFLCQDCLDDFSSFYFEGDAAPEIAIINFATREIRPLVSSCPWFTIDNYLVDCSFEDTGNINLRVTYRPIRYQEQTEECAVSLG